MADDEGFEPSIPCGMLPFQDSGFGHSPNRPYFRGANYSKFFWVLLIF